MNYHLRYSFGYENNSRGRNRWTNIKRRTIFQEMHELLESYPNPKLVLTRANDEQWKQFNLDISPYEVFTLKHNTEKTDPEYFNISLRQYDLKPKEAVYFEHNAQAADIAVLLGITTRFYDSANKTY